MRSGKIPSLLLAIMLPAMSLPALADPAALVVHEWGTFTSLQNEAGESIGRINTDDEPVPSFVHRINYSLLVERTEVPPAYRNSKGTPSFHPDVTLRLETPVLYFHLPQGQRQLRGVTVQARFRGGWLSEFYPDAAADAPGATDITTGFGPLRPDTVGTLVWKDLEVGANGTGPVTAEHVWTAPRAVHAQTVRTARGETEKFLFYRGVAHIDAPLAAVQDVHAGQLVLRSRLASGLAGQSPLQASGAWLVDVRADGTVAFRLIPPLVLGSADPVVATVSTRFEPRDYDRANSARLGASLRQALVAAGLFGDEAGALLSTWDLSYFKSAGMRLFFLVPRAWTDFYLPLEVSADSQITRVMVGRIELVTPEERRGLDEIGQMSAQDVTAEADRMRASLRAAETADQRRFQEVLAGKLQMRAAGVSIPRAYRLYLALGRFRGALVLDEASRHPTPGIKALISAYGLGGYQPIEQSAVPAQALRR
jgi:hypothetical protein